MRTTQVQIHQAQTLAKNYYIPKDTSFIPLDGETRSHLSTKDAAYHLDRSTGTLRRWHNEQSGPITPIKIGSKLLWSVSDIRELLGVAL